MAFPIACNTHPPFGSHAIASWKWNRKTALRRVIPESVKPCQENTSTLQYQVHIPPAAKPQCLLRLIKDSIGPKHVGVQRIPYECGAKYIRKLDGVIEGTPKRPVTISSRMFSHQSSANSQIRLHQYFNREEGYQFSPVWKTIIYILKKQRIPQFFLAIGPASIPETSVSPV
jgi:hypothetical protein